MNITRVDTWVRSLEFGWNIEEKLHLNLNSRSQWTICWGSSSNGRQQWRGWICACWPSQPGQLCAGGAMAMAQWWYLLSSWRNSVLVNESHPRQINNMGNVERIKYLKLRPLHDLRTNAFRHIIDWLISFEIYVSLTFFSIVNITQTWHHFISLSFFIDVRLETWGRLCSRLPEPLCLGWRSMEAIWKAFEHLVESTCVRLIWQLKSGFTRTGKRVRGCGAGSVRSWGGCDRHWCWGLHWHDQVAGWVNL